MLPSTILHCCVTLDIIQVVRYAMRYKVNIKKTDESYAVCCLGLPGCWSQGQPEEEALENIDRRRHAGLLRNC